MKRRSIVNKNDIQVVLLFICIFLIMMTFRYTVRKENQFNVSNMKKWREKAVKQIDKTISPKSHEAASDNHPIGTLERFSGKQQESKKSLLQHRLPNSLIIGVRKGGTMALLTFLGLHPDITIAEKESHFFNTLLYDKGYSYYKSIMPLSLKGQLVMEKTPEYFINKTVPQRVHAMNASIKILLTVRDPVERIISDYAMKKEKAEQRQKYLPSFEKLLFDKNGNINGSEISIIISTYYIHMKRWLRYFPREQFHIVDGENLVEIPFKEIYKAETFLKLKHKVKPGMFKYNKSKGFYCARNINANMVCLPPTKGRTHPDVDASLVKKLRVYFRRKNEKFFELIGRRFEWQ